MDGLIGANVESGDKTYPVKTMLPVPAGSQDVDLADSGPGQGRRAKQKEVLGDYAKDLHKLIPNEGLILSTARSILQGMRGLVDTMDTYGPVHLNRQQNIDVHFVCGPSLRKNWKIYVSV